MMNKNMRRCIQVIVVIVLALLVTGPALATKPEAAVFTFDLVLTGPDSAVGTFTAAGFVDDYGSASQVFWYTDEGNVQGLKTMNGQLGTIYVRFTATPMPTGEAFGHFVVAGGTRAYEKLHGQGDTYAALVFDAEWNPVGIVGNYTGRVHIDP